MEEKLKEVPREETISGILSTALGQINDIQNLLGVLDEKKTDEGKESPVDNLNCRINDILKLARTVRAKTIEIKEFLKVTTERI